MEQSEVRLRLPADLQERTFKELCRRVRVAVESNRIRDEILRSYADQVEGMSQPVSTGPWPNSCQLEDPMTPEHVTQLKAYILAALRNEPYVLIEAQEPGDEEGAANIEAALTTKAQQWGVKKSLADAVHNAVVYPWAPCRVTWEEEYKKVRYMQTVDSLTLQPIDPKQQQIAAEPDPMADPGEELQQQPEQPATHEVPAVRWQATSAGPKMVALNPDDVYLYPPRCQDIDRAEMVIERQLLTRSDLYLGVKKYAWDKDEVSALIAKGPTGEIVDDSIRSGSDETDGQEEDTSEGVYECFLVVGRLPLLFDNQTGECELPEYLQDEDFCFMICHQHDSVFKWGPNPYSSRPYFCYNIDRKPGRLLGKCVPQYLETLQSEATANLRFKIDVANLIANPMVKVTRSWDESHQGFEAYPGAKWVVDNPNDVTPWVWEGNGVQILEGQQAFILNRADKLMSAPGIEQMTPTGDAPPTATQTNMVGQGLTLKRDLFLQTFQEGTEQLFGLMVELWLLHMGDEGETVLANTGEVKVSKDDLERKYRFIPHANSDAANPAIRLQMTQMKQQAQLTYFGSLMQFTPDKWPQLYHGARRALEEMGERNAEAWIGKEPMGIDPMAIIGELAQVAAQLAQSGDPGGVLLLQVLQQATEGQGAPGMQPMPPGNPQQQNGLPSPAGQMPSAPTAPQGAMTVHGGAGMAGRNGAGTQNGFGHREMKQAA